MRDRGRASGRKRKFDNILVSPDKTLLEIIAIVNEGGHGVALVVDKEERLLDIVTDGDFRRAVLNGVDLKIPFSQFRHLEHRPSPLPAGTTRAKAFECLREKQLRQVPLVDRDGRITDLVELDELVSEHEFPTAVVMAGGFGTRLRPLTNNLPKPLLPV